MGKKSGKSDWPKMDIAQLSRLMANRVARIEVLKLEIRQLQKLIDEKMKEER